MGRFIALCSFLIFFTQSSFCSSEHAAGVLHKSPEVSSLRKKIDRHVVYPVFESAGLEGTVAVCFRVNSEGRLKVVEVEADNDALIGYVLSRLNRIKLSAGDPVIGQTVWYRFHFKKQ